MRFSISVFATFELFPFKFKTHSKKSIFQVMAYSTLESGKLYTPDYKMYIRNESGLISPMHDIPLFVNKNENVCNMIVEIPRWSNAKMEICLAEKMNPIKQDIKKEKPRFVANCFPHHGYIWNYGALPQTWENPNVVDPYTSCKGDNDPIDALEIGSRVAKRGEVLQVKILGVVALIDDGETDWKVITIDTKDPMADKLTSISDLDQYFPGLLKATIEWFKIYKIPEGKPENKFAFNGEPKLVDFAVKIVSDCHEHWKELITKKSAAPKISCLNVTVDGSSDKISEKDAEAAIGPIVPVDCPDCLEPAVDKWHFVSLKY